MQIQHTLPAEGKGFIHIFIHSRISWIDRKAYNPRGKKTQILFKIYIFNESQLASKTFISNRRM